MNVRSTCTRSTSGSTLISCTAGGRKGTGGVLGLMTMLFLNGWRTTGGRWKRQQAREPIRIIFVRTSVHLLSRHRHLMDAINHTGRGNSTGTSSASGKLTTGGRMHTQGYRSRGVHQDGPAPHNIIRGGIQSSNTYSRRFLGWRRHHTTSRHGDGTMRTANGTIRIVFIFERLSSNGNLFQSRSQGFRIVHVERSLAVGMSLVHLLLVLMLIEPPTGTRALALVRNMCVLIGIGTIARITVILFRLWV